MAIKPLNSVAGFSVGETPANVILANGDITTGNATLTANVSAGNVKTDHLLYANGDPYQFTTNAAGTNTQIQFNNANNFGSSANLTFDFANNILTLVGNANIGNIYTTGLANITGNVTGGNLNTTGRANIGNLTISGTVTGDLIPATNYGGNLGNSTNAWKDLWLSGTTINLGAQQISSNSSGITTTNTLSTTKLIVTGNANVGNLGSDGVIIAVGNVSGGNLTTGGALSVTGNANVGNLGTSGLIVATGNVTGGNLITSGTVFAPAIVQNASTYDTRVSLNSTAGIVEINSNGNGTQFGPSGVITLSGASKIVGGTFGGSGITLGSTQTDIFQNRGGNVTVQVGTGGTIANTWTFAQDGSFTSPGNIATTASANVGSLNVTGVSNLGSNSNVIITGGSSGQYLRTNGSGNLSWATLSTSSISNGNSNVNIPTANGNVNISAEGNANIIVVTGVGANITGILDVTGNFTAGNITTNTGVFTGNGSGLSAIAGANVTGTVANATYATSAGSAGSATTAGTVTTNAQPNITSVGTLTSLGVNGTVTAVAFTANTGVFTGNGSGLSAIAGANVTGTVANATYATSAGSATTAGTVTTNAQPNITSVGTLTSLTTSGAANVGSLNVTGVSNLGPNGNVIITGGSSGQYLQTDGAGNLSWVSASSSGIANGNSNISIISSGNVNISAIGNSNVVVITGTGANINGTLDVTGNANVGNLGTSGLITATGNVSGGNLTTGGVVAATGNVSGGNLTTGGAVAATGNVSGGNITTGGVVAATGNVSGGNLTTGGVLSVTGNANVGNIGATNAVFTGTLSTTGNANVGNLGTSGLIVATGNVSGGNITTSGAVVATGNVSGGNVLTNTIIGTTLTLNSTGNLVLNPTGNIDANSHYINNVGYPSAPTDAATKSYVDTMVSSGISFHQPVLAATTTTLATATGGTTAYNSPNGAANGIGAYISTTGTFNLIDTANVQTVGTRILVKDEANAAWNGVYTYANTTAIVRSTDADEYGPDSTEQLSINDYFFTTNGSVNKGVAFVVSAPAGTITFGTSNITFSIFSSSAVYTAGTGLTLASNNEFSISNTTVTGGSYGNGDSVATFTVNGQGQLTAASNVVIAANAANLTGTTLASGIVTSSLTTVGTLGTLNVSGNANVGNLGTSGLIVATGNITGGNIVTGGQVVATGNGTFGNISTTGSGGNISGANVISANTFTATANVTGGNLVSTGALSVTGNANVGNIGATRGVFTGNISTATALSIGNTATTWGTVTTSSITANQTISTLQITGTTISGVEFIVKGVDTTGAKYSVATVMAVTDGTSVDYSTFGTVNLGGFTGSLSVNITSSGPNSNIALQVTPASSNSTVWTTQYRVI